ncbi:flagellar hook protein FlgE [uncultured Sphingomonas sp.]|uniref:flagellar hook protein FlgE n=1 Tax=uncultured Sphingomonas sp. TaxID=158754 RepID=UPI0035C9BDC9
MSLYSALSAGVAGLSAQSNAMATVADNITNINTVGYKNVETQFSTLVGDTTSGSKYSAGAVVASAKALISKQGLLAASGSSTDLGIAGQGFFVTTGSPRGGETMQLTRAGSFTPDNEGYLRNTAGLYLQGWPLDAKGEYVNTGNTDALTAIRVRDLGGTATPSTKIQARINLMNTTPASDPAKVAAYQPGDIANGTLPSQFGFPIDVYDQQGGAHQLQLSFAKAGDNSWIGEIHAVPASDVTAADGVLASGEIKFNADGSLDLTGSDPSYFGAFTPTWTNDAGSLPITIELGTDKGTTGLTQFGSPSTPYSKFADGGVLGSVASIDVSPTGVVSAVFADGTKRAAFQLPIATVANPDGVQRISGNAFLPTVESGTFSINAPGSLGSGTIQSKKLETSTADLAEEFTNMIRFQRAYSASSKIITTVDDMLQEVSNLKR